MIATLSRTMSQMANVKVAIEKDSTAVSVEHFNEELRMLELDVSNVAGLPRRKIPQNVLDTLYRIGFVPRSIIFDMDKDVVRIQLEDSHER